MNRLGGSSSPYLRQHRDNPVDWWQWGPDAFAESARTGRPVLLSIGYSACHWCHVMAHESFEDPATAAVMNELFVNVKVDREERPDVDAVYMDAVQALTGRGGWPMTVFCTPDGEPFYGGTYYPRDTFVQLMRAVSDAWRDRRDELQQNVDALVEAVGRTAHIRPAQTFDPAGFVDTVTAALAASADPQWGGFGGAPKFPSSFALNLMLATHDGGSLPSHVELSLDAMAAGGMWDHLGGGFARYSVDEKWLVPHFEKMLYDQALIARSYVRAWRTSGDARHLDVAVGICRYVVGDMTGDDGRMWSAEDADSLDAHGHSEEGAFYTWTPEEMRAVLGDDADAAIVFWNVTDRGNFEGRSILHRIPQRGSVRGDDAIESARQRLFAARASRPRPGLDDKVLTEWTAMMVATLCEVHAAAPDSGLADAAMRSARFLLDNLRDTDGRWLRAWHAEADHTALPRAVAHDLAHVVDAMTRLAALTGDRMWLDEAVDAARQLIEHHRDPVNLGFFTVADDAEQLVVRQKDLMDNATPSANSTAAGALWLLGRMTGDEQLTAHARDTMRLLAGVVSAAPGAFAHAACVARAMSAD